MVDNGREEMKVYTTAAFAAFAALLLQLVAEPAIPLCQVRVGTGAILLTSELGIVW